MGRTLKLIFALLLYLGLLAALQSLPGKSGAGIALLVTVAWLWITEALHVSVTALLVPLLAALWGCSPSTTRCCSSRIRSSFCSLAALRLPQVSSARGWIAGLRRM